MLNRLPANQANMGARSALLREHPQEVGFSKHLDGLYYKC